MRQAQFWVLCPAEDNDAGRVLNRRLFSEPSLKRPKHHGIQRQHTDAKNDDEQGRKPSSPAPQPLPGIRTERQPQHGCEGQENRPGFGSQKECNALCSNEERCFHGGPRKRVHRRFRTIAGSAGDSQGSVGCEPFSLARMRRTSMSKTKKLPSLASDQEALRWGYQAERHPIEEHKAQSSVISSPGKNVPHIASKKWKKAF